MTKKVYDFAKEYSIQSKDFVALLQQANIPIKNHMSNLTDQQEKYFKNNFDVVDGKLVKKANDKAKTAAPKSTVRIISPEAPKAQQSAQSARPQQPAPKAQQNASQPVGARQNSFRDSGHSQNQERPRNNGFQSQRPAQNRTEGTYQRRENRDGSSSYSRRDGTSGSYQGQRREGGYQGQRKDFGNREFSRDGNRDNSGYRPRREQSAQGNNGSYQRREGSPYQKREGGYQGRNNGGGYQNRAQGQNGFAPRFGTSQSYGNRPAFSKGAPGAVDEKPLEKTKNDKFKNNSKQKNDAKNKARESFFEEKSYGRLDNTKKKHGSKSQYKVEKLEKREKRATSGVTGTVVVPEVITVSELSEKILISATDIIKTLMSYGIMANINQSLDFDTVSIICEELGISVELEKEEDLFEKMEQEHFADENKLSKRPPIVTVMGHVDHGKTSLLDAIRKTNVISGEAGGITQHIGAYTVTMRDNPITFIDTPGHKAFTAMRSRGASVTDIAVLVVAADDGVMPQTVEAINHAKAAGVPIVVAINKIDKPTANPDKVKQELTEYGVVCEEWGGDVICAPVSAKNGQGLDNLLDMILLVAEVEDLKANFDMPAIGTVIESRIDKQRGVTASLLVKSGTLREGDYIVIGTAYGKIRVMNNHNGQRVNKAGPSMAVEALGLSEVPAAGDKFIVVENEREAKRITDKIKDRIRIMATKASGPKSLEDIFNKVHEGELKEINLIVKTDVAGSFEAIKQELEKLNDNDDGVKISLLHGGVGDVSETDAALAAASKALIVAFNVKTDNKAKAYSDKEGVEIRSYSVIYDIIDDIEAAIKGLKEPEYEEVIDGHAEVRATFKVPNIGLVAGSYVTDGNVKRSDKVRVNRGGKVVFEGSVKSLKRFQDDVKEVASGYECGIGIDGFDDIKENDILEFYYMREIKE